MKAKSHSTWIKIAQDAEYALDQSGSMLFLYTLFIGSYVLNSPPYARAAFAIALLIFLSPKVICNFYRLRWGCPS